MEILYQLLSGQAENNFTPIQMAKYIAMLTNGGKAIDVTLIKNIITPSGINLDKTEFNSQIKNRLGIKENKNQEIEIKDENLKAVLQGMKSVTTETGGTAYSVFKDFKVEVGGKTGTAEAGEKTNAWFASFAPYENPEIAVVVFIENGEHGSYSAGVTRDIMEAYFGLNEEIQEDKTAKPYINN